MQIKYTIFAIIFAALAAHAAPASEGLTARGTSLMCANSSFLTCRLSYCPIEVDVRRVDALMFHSSQNE